MANTADRRAGAIAQRQLGLLTTQDAIDAGLSPTQIRQRVRSGRWERIGLGVYRIRGAPQSAEHHLLAACFLGPPDTVAHGLSVLAAFDVVEPTAKPHVLVPPHANARHPTAIVHRGMLPTCDRTGIGPIPATMPARALVDAAPLLGDAVLADTLAAAFTRTPSPLTTPVRVEAALARATGGRGPAGAIRLRAALGPWLEGLTPESVGEARLLRRLRDWGIPRPVTQHEVHDEDGRFVARLDLAWPTRRAGLEYDSDRWHTPDRLPADDARHQLLEDLGWWIGHAGSEDLRPGVDRLRPDLETALGLLRTNSRVH